MTCALTIDFRVIIFLNAVEDYLVLWGAFYINNTHLDLAAWLLFKKSSYFANSTDELENHLTKFLDILNQNEELKLTEEDFKVNELTNNITACETGYSGKDLYKKIADDFRKKGKSDNKKSKSGIKNLIVVAALILVFATAIFFIGKKVIDYVRWVRISSLSE